MIDKEKWLNDNTHKSKLLGNLIIPMRPNIGFFVTVNGIDIPEDVFKEEYDIIWKTYFSVMNKMSEQHKTNKHDK